MAVALDKVYTGTVVEEDGELMLVFPQEMIEELGWEEGDNIVWDVDDNNRVVIAKKEKKTDGSD
jgi:bifunctional DNA-binding transcriptional regulator/antitoxin component of YhaV-PrlF toxin-antitoxin module